MAAPCTHMGSARAAKSASGVKPARMKEAAAKRAKATVALIRVSSRPRRRAEIGDMITATTPAGASTRPAQVAMKPSWVCSHRGNSTVLEKNAP